MALLVEQENIGVYETVWSEVAALAEHSPELRYRAYSSSRFGKKRTCFSLCHEIKKIAVANVAQASG